MFNREKFFEYVINLYLNQSNRFTQGQVYRILYELHKHGMLFHLDDNPSDVGHYEGDQWVNLFTNREAAILRTVQPAFFGIETLPDYEGCPHRICCELTMSDQAEGRYPTLPLWGFSFDDEPENRFKGYTYPNRWNGWGVPLLQWCDVLPILIEGEYTYTVEHPDNANHREDLPPVFTITGDPNQEVYEEPLVLKGFDIRTTKGTLRHVYDMGNFGLCFNVDECLEANPHDWEGYL